MMKKQGNLSLQPPPKAVDQIWTPDDIYDAVAQDIEIVRRFKEDRRVERKLATFAARELGDYFSIYANRQPDGGVIFIGVTDDGDLDGCKRISPAQLNDIERAGSVHCPEARIESKMVEVYNQKGQPDFIIAIRVYYHPDKLVETVRREAFTREGSSKRKLSDLEKREIRIKKGEIDFEREDVPLNWPSDFDQALINEYVNNYSVARRLTSRQTPEEILTDSRLGRRAAGVFTPNVACALLFAKDPRTIFPGAYIRIMRFGGTSERTGSQYNLVSGKDFWVDGPLPRQIAEAEEVMMAEVRQFTRLNADGKFETRPEYPKDVWLEAIVNACVHRSYNLKNMVTFVKLFDDKIIVENPGGFHPPTTAETISDIGHNPRNPHLMNALFHLDLVKCAHEGTRRMVEEMSEANLPAPEFSEVSADGHLVRVILRNNFEHRKNYIDASVEVPISADLYKSLTDNERAVVNCLAERGPQNITGVQKLLGVHWATAKKVCDSLIAKEICELAVKKDAKTRDPRQKIRLVQ